MSSQLPEPLAVDLVQLGDFVAGLVAFDPAVGEGDQVLRVERLALDLPVEIAIGDDETGAVGIEASPPTQHVETAVLPVFHRLRVTLQSDR